MIKSITCRVHNTEWQLVRLDKQDFEQISRLGIAGHPAYYRVVPAEEHHTTNDTYEVWPLPVPGVEVIPVYEDKFVV